MKAHRGCDGHFKPKHGEWPGLIAEHGQAGVTPSSCVRNAAWLNGLAVCWPRRPPIVRVCCMVARQCVVADLCVCGFHCNTRHPNTETWQSWVHRKNAPAGITPPPPSMQLALTELAHPHPLMQFSRIAMLRSHTHWDAARRAPAVRISARKSHPVRHTLIIGCARLGARVCA